MPSGVGIARAGGKASGVKVVSLDIENSPNIGDVWGLFNQNISLNQLRETAKVIAFSAKVRGSDDVHFYSVHHNSHEDMLQAAWDWLNNADVLVTYNGKRFDVPHLYRELAIAHFQPPSPVQHVDLLEVVKQRFLFTSNKLDHVAQQLGLGGKVSHEGHTLWVKCMAGDDDAWARMREYNEGDTRLTEKLYERLLPWITRHPHAGLYAENGTACPVCGEAELTRQGYALTALSKFQRYRCAACGAWSRGKFAVATVDVRSVA